MAEYIERNSAVALLRERGLEVGEEIGPVFANGIFDAVRFLSGFPAADVAPVRRGRWIEGAENFTCGNHNAECSVCGANISWSGCDEDFNFCPACGAKMDKEEN